MTFSKSFKLIYSNKDLHTSLKVLLTELLPKLLHKPAFFKVNVILCYIFVFHNSVMTLCNILTFYTP